MERGRLFTSKGPCLLRSRLVLRDRDVELQRHRRGLRGGLLVPLPGAADGHQSVNAEVLVRAGAAELLPQEALTGESMAARILALAGDPARYREMGVAARGLGRPDAVKVIVDRGEQLMGYR